MTLFLSEGTVKILSKIYLIFFFIKWEGEQNCGTDVSKWKFGNDHLTCSGEGGGLCFFLFLFLFSATKFCRKMYLTWKMQMINNLTLFFFSWCKIWRQITDFHVLDNLFFFVLCEKNIMACSALLQLNGLNIREQQM